MQEIRYTINIQQILNSSLLLCYFCGTIVLGPKSLPEIYMRSEEFICPSCGRSDIIKTNRKIVRCKYCDTLLTVEYDPEDTKISKLKAPAQGFKVQKKQKLVSWILIGIICALLIYYYCFNSKTQAMNFSDSENATGTEASTNIYEIGYVSKLSEIPEDTFNSFEDTALEAVSSIYLSTMDTIAMVDEPECIGVYLLCNKNDDTNLLYFAYHVTWGRTLKNGDVETVEAYPAFYFSNIMLMSDGSVQSDFKTWNENPSIVLGNSFVFGYNSKIDFYNKCISSRPDYKVKKK